MSLHNFFLPNINRIACPVFPVIKNQIEQTSSLVQSLENTVSEREDSGIIKIL